MNDPNILGATYTPGPWGCVKASEGNLAVRCPGYLIATLNKPGHWSDQEERYAREMARYEADQHLISAAPEAIEFIADLLEVLSKGDDHLVAEMIPLAEEILKKAYNF